MHKTPSYMYMYINVYSSMLGDTDYQTYVCPQSNSITTLYQINMSYHCFEVTLKFKRHSPIRIYVSDIFSKGGWGNTVLIVTKQTRLSIPILLSINSNSLSYNICEIKKN